MAASSSSEPPIEDISQFTVEGIAQSKASQAKAHADAMKDAQTEARSMRLTEKMMSQNVKMHGEREKAALKKEVRVAQESEAAVGKALMGKITKYLEAFPWLQTKVPKMGAKVSVPELQEILDIIRTEMDTQRSLIQLHKYVDYGFMIGGNWWGDGQRFTKIPKELRFNLTHLAEYHKRGFFNQELEPILMEIDIEYPWLGRQSLLLRALGTLSEVLVKTHLINTNPEARKVLGLETTPPKEVPGLDKL